MPILTLALLTFVCSGERYSTYLDEHGDEIYLANGHVMRRMIETDDLPELWSQFVDGGRIGEDGWPIDGPSWLEALRDLMLDEYAIDDEVHWCTDCETLVMDDDVMRVGTEGDTVCENCFNSYYECTECNVRFQYTTTTLNQEEVCLDCRDRHYSYCEHCDGWRHDHDEDHYHDEDGCDCESPAMTFSVPHHGGRLDNDTEVVVSLPAGVISEQGLEHIQYLIRDTAYVADGEERMTLFNVVHLVNEVGNEWQTKQGNFTKRLSKLAYQRYAYKISTDLLAKIGTTAREHSSGSDMTISVTRDLNQAPEEFAHEGSCWWSEYAQSRCALKSNGGFGLRSFAENTPYYSSTRVNGRVWVMPLKSVEGRLKPTFNAETPDAFIVFNGYEELNGYVGARVMAHMAGMSYRKIPFSSSPMYINAGGYLVANEEILSAHASHGLSLNLNQHSSLHYTESQEAAHVA